MSRRKFDKSGNSSKGLDYYTSLAYAREVKIVSDLRLKMKNGSDYIQITESDITDIGDSVETPYYPQNQGIYTKKHAIFVGSGALRRTSNQHLRQYFGVFHQRAFPV